MSLSVAHLEPYICWAHLRFLGAHLTMYAEYRRVVSWARILRGLLKPKDLQRICKRPAEMPIFCRLGSNQGEAS